MARRRPGDEPGDELWIARALKAEAERHEPDQDRIRQRIRDRDAGVIPVGDLSSFEEQRLRRSGDPFRRSGRLIPAAAAAFVVFTAGAITAVYGSDHPSGASPPPVRVIAPASGDNAAPPSAAPTSAPQVSPTTSSATSDPAKSESTTTGTSPPGASSTGSTAERRPGVQVRMAAADPGQAVNLSEGQRDWIAAGSRSAQQTVRMVSGKQEISGPHVSGDPVSSTASGPFALSWSGGMPESRGSGSRTWLTVAQRRADAPKTGLQIRVPAGTREGVLVLYVGASSADGQLWAYLGDRTQVTVTNLKAGPKNSGYVATIRFRAPRAGEELTVELLGGSGGSVSLAAATLR